MYVCLCNRVTDSQILDAAGQGANTLEALSQQLKMATCCGRCTECIHDLLASHMNQTMAQNRLMVA
ncbi:MAG: (2Fe-2S)-binding protein [Chromatiales bacterium]|jgi:bacterioferritin-associated ferredoxin